MRIAMEIKLPSPKSTPKQTRCCERYDYQRCDCLPVHGGNINGRAGLESVFI